MRMSWWDCHQLQLPRYVHHGDIMVHPWTFCMCKTSSRQVKVWLMWLWAMLSLQHLLTAWVASWAEKSYFSWLVYCFFEFRRKKNDWDSLDQVPTWLQMPEWWPKHLKAWAQKRQSQALPLSDAGRAPRHVWSLEFVSIDICSILMCFAVIVTQRLSVSHVLRRHLCLCHGMAGFALDGKNQSRWARWKPRWKLKPDKSYHLWSS